MMIIEKKWKYGTYKAYANVPEELLQFEKGCRVQPAPFDGKPQPFYLLNRYEPGENKFFPNGGFEVRGDNSVRYSYDLDQVILYKDKKVKITVPKSSAKKTTKKAEPVAKKAAAPKTEKKVCGAPKKDGTPCQMKTDGGLCRHHKAK